MVPASDASRPPRVLTVPSGTAFMPAFARALLTDSLGVGTRVAGPNGEDDLFALARTTIFLPTRRAARGFSDAMLDAAGGKAMLLPRIRAIGSESDDADLISDAGDSGIIAEIAPGVTPLERRLVLTELVLKWGEATAAASVNNGEQNRQNRMTPARAAGLAGELGNLMDMVETEGVDFSNLGDIVPEVFSEHWKLTLDFLSIVTQYWPMYLDERGLLAPAARRNRILRNEAVRLTERSVNTGGRAKSAGPTIVAGVTGSVPASAALMDAVARLANGALILPGIDFGLDDATWNAVRADHPEHPQHGLARLLADLGMERRDLGIIMPDGQIQAAGCMADDPCRDGFYSPRMRLISDAMRPAPATADWAKFAREPGRIDVDAALGGMMLVEADNAEEEAAVIALMMRGVAEEPGRTAALVSPDRLLARRVAVKLEAVGIRIDDSAGRPLGKTVPGAFLDLVIESVSSRFSPATVMALLKHPFCQLGYPPADVRRRARLLERALFRQPTFGDGLSALRERALSVEAAIRDDAESTRRPRHIALEDWDQVHELIARLEETFQPLENVFIAGEALSLSALAVLHAETADRLSQPKEEISSEANGEGPEPDVLLPQLELGLNGPTLLPSAAASRSLLWVGDAGEVASQFLASLITPTGPEPSLDPADYAEFYRALVAGVAVRAGTPVHPRLSIWGPYEARLQQPDLVILGGLNDGVWPAIAEPDPWLNRPMRETLGLPSPEQQMGLAAHDFTQLAGAPEVVLTRSKKIDGVPRVPSRWLLRLDALLAGLGAGERLRSDDARMWLDWTREIALAGEHRPLPRPEPRPPVAARPRRLSATAVGTWIANPYAIYAQYILRLRRLNPLGMEPDARLRGVLLHHAMHRFALAFPESLPPNAADWLTGEAKSILADFSSHPRVAAFWQPRFRRFADWFAAHEGEMREGTIRVLGEVSGGVEITAPAGPFLLTARADRIDLRDDGAIAIYDYKTGNPPKAAEIKRLRQPQLPLEAMIAAQGGFEGVAAGAVTRLAIISATGGEPPGELSELTKVDFVELAAAAENGLRALVARFDDPATPYAALRRGGDFKDAYRYDDYEHLARVKEWSVIEGDENDG